MKEQTIKYAAKALIVMAIFLQAPGFGAIECKASETLPDSLSIARVRYDGATENLLTFSVFYANPSGQQFTLEVRNEQSEVLFRHVYNAKNFSKKIHLLKTTEQASVSFGIKSGKEIITESFSIRPEIKVVDNLIVKRL